MPALEKMTMILEPGKYYHLFSRGNNRGLIFFRKENYDYFIHSKVIHYMSDYMEVLAWSLIPNHYHLTVLIKPIKDIFIAAERDFGNIPHQVLINFPELSMPNINLQNLNNLANLSLSEVEDLSSSEGANMSPSNDASNLYSFNNLANLYTTIPSELQTKLAARLVSERLRRCLLGYAKAINKQENRTGSLFQKIMRRDILPEIDDVRRNIAYVHRNPIHHKMCKDYHTWNHSSYNKYLKMKNSKPSSSEIRAFEIFGGSDAFFEYHDYYLHRWKDQQIEEWE